MKKLLSYIPYELKEQTIILSKKQYSITSLRIQAFVIRYLGLVLIVMGVMNILAGRLLVGIGSCVIAVCAILIGYLYKMIVKKAYKEYTKV